MPVSSNKHSSHHTVQNHTADRKWKGDYFRELGHARLTAHKNDSAVEEIKSQYVYIRNEIYSQRDGIHYMFFLLYYNFTAFRVGYQCVFSTSVI